LFAVAVAAVVVVVSLLAGLMYFLWVADTSGHAEHNVAEGDRIVHALQKYKAARGTYPQSLRDLVPEFLENIPQPKRAEWIYKPAPDRQQFMLCFEGGDQDAVGCYDSNGIRDAAGNYDPTSLRWQVDTK
jgi:hypothetical protein